MTTDMQSLVALPAAMDLDALDSVRETLIAALERGATTVSGEAVERVSTNGLMLLLSAASSARRNGGELALIAPSASMQAAIARLGLAPSFASLIGE